MGLVGPQHGNRCSGILDLHGLVATAKEAPARVAGWQDGRLDDRMGGWQETGCHQGWLNQCSKHFGWDREWLDSRQTRPFFVIYLLKKNILMNDILWLELGYVGASNTYSIKNHVKPNSFWSPCIRTHHRTLLLKRVRFWGGTALWTWLCGREPHKSFSQCLNCLTLFLRQFRFTRI